MKSIFKLFILLLLFSSCGNNSNKKVIDKSEVDSELLQDITDNLLTDDVQTYDLPTEIFINENLEILKYRPSSVVGNWSREEERQIEERNLLLKEVIVKFIQTIRSSYSLNPEGYRIYYPMTIRDDYGRENTEMIYLSKTYKMSESFYNELRKFENITDITGYGETIKGWKLYEQFLKCFLKEMNKEICSLEIPTNY